MTMAASGNQAREPMVGAEWAEWEGQGLGKVRKGHKGKLHTVSSSELATSLPSIPEEMVTVRALEVKPSLGPFRTAGPLGRSFSVSVYETLSSSWAPEPFDAIAIKPIVVLPQRSGLLP